MERRRRGRQGRRRIGGGGRSLMFNHIKNLDQPKRRPP
jgi:hypothetical protein